MDYNIKVKLSWLIPGNIKPLSSNSPKSPSHHRRLWWLYAAKKRTRARRSFLPRRRVCGCNVQRRPGLYRKWRPGHRTCQHQSCALSFPSAQHDHPSCTRSRGLRSLKHRKILLNILQCSCLIAYSLPSINQLYWVPRWSFNYSLRHIFTSLIRSSLNQRVEPN